MKRTRLLITAAVLAAMALAPQAAFAAGQPGGARQVDSQLTAAAQALTPDPPREGCKDGDCKGLHGRDNVAFRIYAAMTGKPVEDLRKACEDGKTTIWQIAKKDGKLEALKAKLLEVRAASLDALVKGGAMTQEERDRILAHIRDELDKKS
jgi:hypothetical protein